MNFCFTDQVIQVILKEVDRKAGEMGMIQSVWHCSRRTIKSGNSLWIGCCKLSKESSKPLKGLHNQLMIKKNNVGC